MNIAFASSEVVPFSQTGGLADVAGALPAELAGLGHTVSVYTPYYRCVKAVDPKAEVAAQGVVPVGSEMVPWTLYASSLSPARPAGPRRSKRGSLRVYFIACDAYFDREGLYGPRDGDYPDNCSRFVFFCQACLAAARARGEPPDVWHCHDWQAALIPVYLKLTLAGDPFHARAASVFSIHNLSYLGQFWHWDWPLLNLPWQHYNWRELELHGRMSLLKGALVHSGLLLTVSATYAREIQSAAYGCQLEGVLAERKDVLFGIVNGMDARTWNPRTDALLPANYSPEDLAGKQACKKALREKLNLPQDSTAVVGMVGRLVDQKFGLVARCLDELLKRNIQLAILGEGREDYQQFLQRTQAAHPGKVAAVLTFDNALAHLIEAGADIFLMPSSYEPCGLNQLYSLAYGTPPLVHGVGGLADT
ncbi:MAG: glycogen/starch synthase, partial [Planctomycetota bacterium]